MQTSRIMSRTKRQTSTPFLPKLPIEVWFKTATPYKFSLDDEDKYLFHARQAEYKARTVRGVEYLDGLLAINTPQQLVTFMNTYDCPITWARPFWKTFLEVQASLKLAMRSQWPSCLVTLNLLNTLI